MGKDAFEQSPAARAVFEQADQALGQSLSTLCFDGPMEELTLTANTQPAIVATSAALLAAARERLADLPSPSFAAGHSLGEYSALVAAGALPLADAIRVVRVRGEAMQQAVPAGVGAMAAIMGPDGAAVGELCADVSQDDALVSAANFNAPTQTVVAGHAAAVELLVERAKAGGARAIPLKVSAPFHCALMAPARDALRDALSGADVAAPSIEVLANVDAEAKAQPEQIVQSLLDQVDHSVRWVQTIEAMRRGGVTHAIEIGPGKVLTGLNRRIDKTLKTLAVGSMADLGKLNDFLEMGS
jgi:[acyl-carrier-protein] S-malonyltransferase